MKTIINRVITILFLIQVYLSPQHGMAQCAITGNVNASTLNCGTAPLSACNGILYIGNGVTAATLNMNNDLDLTCLGAIQLIVSNNATLAFTPGNDHLTLADGSSIIIQSGGNLSGDPVMPLSGYTSALICWQVAMEAQAQI